MGDVIEWDFPPSWYVAGYLSRSRYHSSITRLRPIIGIGLSFVRLGRIIQVHPSYWRCFSLKSRFRIRLMAFYLRRTSDDPPSAQREKIGIPIVGYVNFVFNPHVHHAISTMAKVDEAIVNRRTPMQRKFHRAPPRIM